MKRTFLVAMAAVAASSYAGLINPLNLQQSPDGANKNLQQLLIDHGYSSTVGTTIPLYGDQTATEMFEQCERTMIWSILWQEAGYAPRHKLGYYTVANPTAADVTWVIGGTATGLPTTQSLSIAGPFGLAFSSGDNANIPLSTLYFSETAHNADVLDHMASFQLRVGNAPPSDCEQIISWEDLPQLGDKDYNDFGVILQGAHAVPEPASLLAFGVGLVGIVSRRFRKTA